MDLITIDFETYYDKDYSLRKITTEEYIRDDRFEVIGVAVKVNNDITEWASGSHEEIYEYLHTFNWANSMVVAHNNLFDGAILGWHFDIHPKLFGCTLCIARALHGVEVGGSLAAVAKRYSVGAKGTEVLDAIGKRREDFSAQELDAYSDYCINDVDLCYELFKLMGKSFPKKEIHLIDRTLRMFIEPILELDKELLADHLVDVKRRKQYLLDATGVDKKDLMSNPKFAALLEAEGVDVPMKESLTTGKQTYAFAKTDAGFKALGQHENLHVQALVAARLGTKSTLEETRTQRFIDIAGRGALPVPIRYYAAHTGRWGGDDKINMQNLPSRGVDGKKLKKSIRAPAGYMLVDCDSSQIEARVLAWLANQQDLVDAFDKGEDVYKHMASDIYGVAVEDVTKEQRFVGKTAILGAGYGMGAQRFKEQLKAQSGVVISLDESRRIINVYRDKNWKITHFWRACQNMLVEMSRNSRGSFGFLNTVKFTTTGLDGRVHLPNGLYMRYDNLDYEQGERGPEFNYMTRKGRNRIYGGKVTENICQALARIIIGEQLLLISKKYKVTMTVHDSIVCAVPKKEVKQGQAYIEQCMRYVPTWCKGMPLDCESGFDKTYGGCE